MSTSSLYAKLKHFFPNDIENINIPQFTQNYLDDFQSLSFLISSNLPHLSIDQIHSLCKKQEKNVMDKILQIKHIDLYQQIANVCPSQKDLKTMPADEVALKINHYTAKMALQQRMRIESEQENNSYSDESEVMSEESQSMVQPMEIDQINYEPLEQVKGLHNIFEEEYNAHLPWNEMCIYDLN